MERDITLASYYEDAALARWCPVGTEFDTDSVNFQLSYSVDDAYRQTELDTQIDSFVMCVRDVMRTYVASGQETPLIIAMRYRTKHLTMRKSVARILKCLHYDPGVAGCVTLCAWTVRKRTLAAEGRIYLHFEGASLTSLVNGV